MQVENIIFLNAKFKNQENPNHFDLNEKSELLHYLERKFTYTYAKSTQFKDVIFLDFNKHYIKLLKDHLFSNISNINTTPVGSRLGTDDKHEIGALENLNAKIFPISQLYHYILLISERNGTLPLSNTNFNSELGEEFESGIHSKANARLTTEHIRLSLLNSLFKNYGYTRGDLDTNWEFSAYDATDHINHLSKHYEIDAIFASYLYELFMKNNSLEFTSQNFNVILDEFVKYKIQDLVDVVFLLDNYSMLPDWGKWRNVPSQYGLSKVFEEYSSRNVIEVNNKLIGDIDTEIGYSERRHYRIDSGPTSWNYDSENYIRHRNRVKTLVVVNAPLTINMLNRSTRLPKKVQTYVMKLVEVDKVNNSTVPEISTSLMNENIRNNRSVKSKGINYLSTYIDNYPFDYIIQFSKTGSIYSFDTFKNKIAKVINQLTYKSTLPNVASDTFSNHVNNYANPSIVFTSSAIDLKNMQYRFKNKGIFSINLINQLIEARNDDSNTIDMWNYEYDLFQSGFDYHTFNYNDFISNINLIADNATIIKANNISVYVNYQCIQKILKDDNIDSEKYKNDVKQDLNTALNNLESLIDYEYLIEVDEMNINVQDIRNTCGKNVAFKFFYDMRFELTDFMRVIGLVMREFNNPKIILDSNTLESFNLSKLLITAIYKNMQRSCEIYCTYKESFKSTSFYELFSDEVVKQ